MINTFKINRQFHSGIADFYKHKLIAKEMVTVANIITAGRILFSLLLLFFPAFSPMFYNCYCLAALTDMLDGFIARKTNAVSEFGSKFDTVADFVFIVICLIKLLPEIQLSIWLYIWILLISVIKIINVCLGYALHKKLAAEHTVMNKITGLLLFLLPLTLSVIDLKISATILCSFATFAAIQEEHLIRTKD